jgi:Polyketide cyclase / dehydrase and lipid transport
MLKKILIGVALIIVIFVAIVATRPDEFRVTRSATFSATPSQLFEHVNDLHKWQTWSPWAKLDPAAKLTFDGPQAGTGAAFSWVGNKEVGEGKMTITESRPTELVRFRLEFVKPFAGTNDAEFTFKPDGNKTVVTWSMSGKNNFLFKAVGLFMDCDKMVGGEFEKGFANLRSVVEVSAAK